MTNRPTTPRILPLPEDERSEGARELLDLVWTPGHEIDGSESPFWSTMVRHEGLTRRYLPFGGKLLHGKLPPRDREILILRTAWNGRSEYTWAHHVGIGMGAGLTEEEINRIPFWRDEEWSTLENALCRAADELYSDRCIGDETWTILASSYDERQLIEIPFLVGQYQMTSMVVLTLGIQKEADCPQLPTSSARMDG